MIRVTVDIPDAVKRATRERKRDIAAGLILIAEAIRNEIAQYPGVVKYPIAWVSPAQRRAFFAKMRRAGDTIPYRRSQAKTSQRLGKSYTIIPKGLVVFVKSRASYSSYVQSARYQQPFHRNTGWKTDIAAIRAVVNNRRLWREIARLMR